MFGDKEFYGYDIHKQLLYENNKIELSRLYRILNEMLREGLLEAYWERSQYGPKKRVYKLSNKGREELNKILLDAIKTVHSFYGKYLVNLPPKTNVFNNICSFLTSDLQDISKIAYLISKYSKMHEKIICGIYNKEKQAKIYFIKPDLVKIDLKMDNLLFLDGSYNYIPIRENHLDRLIVINFPPEDSLYASIKEWHRTLKQNGKLAIMTPTILIQKYEDPLTIGDFMEKYEYKNRDENEQISKEFIISSLNKFFNKVEEKQIIHISLFIASEPHSL
jgi:DNA-binding PadR family transcriptional regulator